ncbi:unnamed protein product [Hymenolepis diminuta]|uniref:Uncharacterized protein n=1 Tax=Hymenolepis diminuta TaxID=6216 RepID=A0A564YLE5_HYMDI|nr:unnamed protein product [Hymenolepis diminuta]
MDPSTGRLSPLPNMVNPKKWPAFVTTENKIFVFSDGMVLDSPGVYSSEVYEAASGRWSPLSPMIEERRLCAAVSIGNSRVLVTGGIGRNQVYLRSTELLTQLSGEGGGGEKWQWRPFSPMNEEHGGDLPAAYLQGRVYVVGSIYYIFPIPWRWNTKLGQTKKIWKDSTYVLLTTIKLK